MLANIHNIFQEQKRVVMITAERNGNEGMSRNHPAVVMETKGIITDGSGMLVRNTQAD